ncbi:MAG: hypothetical protein LAO09_09750 [Acidobacteriia bacterium]|nr:hypothetical protein [Terriglobia bacterium]
MVGFQQAVIKVEREKEFAELKGAISRAFGSEKVEKFLKRLDSSNVRVRDWESVLAARLFEKVDETLAKSGQTAQSLYQSLTVSDQAQMREFYLSRVEEIDPELRARFQKLYRYY